MFRNKRIFLTGGTGSFGNWFTKEVLRRNPSEIIIYSRDEEKQLKMKRKFNDERLRFVLGNVRDYERLLETSKNVDYVIHAAALKIIPTIEKNPIESVRTNILGSWNIRNAVLKNEVEKALFLSTDKAVKPVNLYGICKAAAEKLWVSEHHYESRLAISRWGNVIGSRGSVVPFFKKLIEQKKPLPITHPDMTRFLITLKQAINLVFTATENMKGGEIYVPKLPSCRIVDLAKVLAGKNYPLKYVGIRPGEKIHEVLVSEEEFRRTEEKDNYYIIHPYGKYRSGKVKEEYTSETALLLGPAGIKKLLQESGWL